MLKRCVGPMQARGDQNQDVLAGDSAVLQDAQEGAEDHFIGHRPRHIADQNTGVSPSGGDLRIENQAGAGGSMAIAEAVAIDGAWWSG